MPAARAARTRLRTCPARFSRLRLSDPRDLYDQVFMPYHHELDPERRATVAEP